MRKTAFTAKPAISRTQTRTLPGFPPKAAEGRTIQICDQPGRTSVTVPPHRTRQARSVRTARRSCGCGAKRPFSASHSVVRAHTRDRHLIGASPVTVLSFGRCTAGSAVAAFLAAAPFQIGAQPSSALQSTNTSASGSYLAARHAGQQRDAAAAASYYRAALKRDPNNPELLDRAFLSFLVDGDVDEAVKFAERVAQADKNDRVARLVLGVNALKRKQYASAKRDLAQSIRGPITDLTASLLSAWSTFAANDSKGAIAAIDHLAGPDWYAIFKDLHA